MDRCKPADGSHGEFAVFEQVAKACQVGEIHEVIGPLPKEYQTEIGERGVGLSGGQKQRPTIARALIKQSKILIFDEATSGLDVATAEHFCATIDQLKGKVTMLFITQALPKNLQIDEIVQIVVPRPAPRKQRAASLMRGVGILMAALLSFGNHSAYGSSLFDKLVGSHMNDVAVKVVELPNSDTATFPMGLAFAADRTRHL